MSSILHPPHYPWANWSPSCDSGLEKERQPLFTWALHPAALRELGVEILIAYEETEAQRSQLVCRRQNSEAEFSPRPHSTFPVSRKWPWILISRWYTAPSLYLWSPDLTPGPLHSPRDSEEASPPQPVAQGNLVPPGPTAQWPVAQPTSQHCPSGWGSPGKPVLKAEVPPSPHTSDTGREGAQEKAPLGG